MFQLFAPYIQFRFEAGMPTALKSHLQIFGTNHFLVSHTSHGLEKGFLAKEMAHLGSSYRPVLEEGRLRENAAGPLITPSLFSRELGPAPCNLMLQIHKLFFPCVCSVRYKCVKDLHVVCAHMNFMCIRFLSECIMCKECMPEYCSVKFMCVACM